ncbi:PH domain-containing protein [Glycomyces sp. L485]|uniref:PH domain-containing protein n=1 Tax=Glycomyces sp. L485 TaxID=2909235 RepID=UPI001F4ACA70|nr:PH domain-containing protein [Glycomyces sp. L485]MCH7230031.1 PH domain-containing protein [Glycomyces sp. L485]
MSPRESPVWDQWPTDLDWQPMAPDLRTVRLLGMAIRLLIVALVLLVPLVIWLGAEGILYALGTAAAIAALRSWIIVRAVRAWGFAEREKDLLVKHGLLFRELSIVPYGRIQLVDLKAGPIERAFSLTTVQIRTAALGAITEIPGLHPQAAQGLRDRLSARAAEVREGL